MAGSDCSNTEVTSFDLKFPGSGCRRPIRLVLGTFELHRAVTRRRWQSRDGNDVT